MAHTKYTKKTDGELPQEGPPSQIPPGADESDDESFSDDGRIDKPVIISSDETTVNLEDVSDDSTDPDYRFPYAIIPPRIRVHKRNRPTRIRDKYQLLDEDDDDILEIPTDEDNTDRGGSDVNIVRADEEQKLGIDGNGSNVSQIPVNECGQVDGPKDTINTVTVVDKGKGKVMVDVDQPYSNDPDFDLAAYWADDESLDCPDSSPAQGVKVDQDMCISPRQPILDTQEDIEEDPDFALLRSIEGGPTLKDYESYTGKKPPFTPALKKKRIVYGNIPVTPPVDETDSDPEEDDTYNDAYEFKERLINSPSKAIRIGKEARKALEEHDDDAATVYFQHNGKLYSVNQIKVKPHNVKDSSPVKKKRMTAREYKNMFKPQKLSFSDSQGGDNGQGGDKGGPVDAKKSG